MGPKSPSHSRPFGNAPNPANLAAEVKLQSGQLSQALIDGVFICLTPGLLTKRDDGRYECRNR